MSNNIYNILNNFNKVANEAKPAVTEQTPKSNTKTKLQENMEQVSEKYMGFKKTVAAIKKGGSAENPEAVAASIGRKKYGKEKFQKAAAAGKKLGEGEVYTINGKKCTKAEYDAEMKKAGKKVKEGNDGNLANNAKPYDKVTRGDVVAGRLGKDEMGGKKKKKVNELSTDLLTRYRKKATDQSMHAHGLAKGTSVSQYQDAQRGEEVYDNPAQATALAKKREAGADIAGYKLGKKWTNDPNKSREYAITKAVDAKRQTTTEVAPPGAKAERMVKHIKKGYAKDGKLTPKEKGIAYATAWKAHNKGKLDETIKELLAQGFTKEQIAEGWDDMLKSVEKQRKYEKGTGKFDKKKDPTTGGTIYSRKYDPKSGESEETGKDSEGNAVVKRGRGRPKKSQFESKLDRMVDEAFGDHTQHYMDLNPDQKEKPKLGQRVMNVAKKVGKKALDTLGHPDDEAMKADLRKKMGLDESVRDIQRLAGLGKKKLNEAAGDSFLDQMIPGRTQGGTLAQRAAAANAARAGTPATTTAKTATAPAKPAATTATPSLSDRFNNFLNQMIPGRTQTGTLAQRAQAANVARDPQGGKITPGDVPSPGGANPQKPQAQADTLARRQVRTGQPFPPPMAAEPMSPPVKVKPTPPKPGPVVKPLPEPDVVATDLTPQEPVNIDTTPAVDVDEPTPTPTPTPVQEPQRTWKDSQGQDWKDSSGNSWRQRSDNEMWWDNNNPGKPFPGEAEAQKAYDDRMNQGQKNLDSLKNFFGIGNKPAAEPSPQQPTTSTTPGEPDEFKPKTNPDGSMDAFKADTSQTVAEEDMNQDLEEMMRLAGMREALKGGQKKLDKNHNGKLDSQDFAMLRGNKVDEGDMEEGNEFSGALDAARDAGEDKFEVDGKTYPVKEAENIEESKCMECGMYESKCKCDNIEESLNVLRRIAGLKECMSPMGNGMTGQEEGKMNVTTNMSSDGTKNVTISADGDSAVELMQMLKLAGMGGGHTPHVVDGADVDHPGAIEIHGTMDAEGAEELAHELRAAAGDEEVDESKDERYHASTTPDEEVEAVQAQLKGGNGDVAGQEKKMRKHGYQFSDNNLAMKEVAEGINGLSTLGSRLLRDYNSIKVKK